VASSAAGSKALEARPKTRDRRCRVHKIADVPSKLPKSRQSKAKRKIVKSQARAVAA
jgi:hypothetical protein